MVQPPGTAHPAQKPGAVKKEPTVTKEAAAPTATDGAATTEVKEPKVKKVRERKEGAVVRPRLPKPPDDHIITVLKPNAKREASGLRFNEYKTGMTVKQYVDLMTAPPWNRTVGQVFADIRWDTEEHRKFIHIGPTIVDVPAPAPAKAPAATEQPASGASPTA
jgi:hypothetical protein